MLRRPELARRGIQCGALRIPVAALEQLDVQGGATLFVVSHLASEVDAGDWRVFVGVSDWASVYGTVEIQ